jgi:hypothetical protein
MKRRMAKKLYKRELARFSASRAEVSKLRDLLDRERDRHEYLLRDIDSYPFPGVIRCHAPKTLAYDLRVDDWFSSRHLPAVRFLFWRDCISAPNASTYHARMNVFGLDDPLVDPRGIHLAQRIFDDLVRHLHQQQERHP